MDYSIINASGNENEEEVEDERKHYLFDAFEAFAFWCEALNIINNFILYDKPYNLYESTRILITEINL